MFFSYIGPQTFFVGHSVTFWPDKLVMSKHVVRRRALDFPSFVVFDPEFFYDGDGKQTVTVPTAVWFDNLGENSHVSQPIFDKCRFVYGPTIGQKRVYRSIVPVDSFEGWHVRMVGTQKHYNAKAALALGGHPSHSQGATGYVFPSLEAATFFSLQYRN